MSYQLIFLISLLIVESSVMAMDSLISRAGLKVISNNLDTSRLPEGLDRALGYIYCKENLPRAFEVFVEKAFLQKRTPDEGEYEKFAYPCKQVEHYAGSILGLTFVGDTTLAVVVGKNNYMQWWDTETGKLLEEVLVDKSYRNLASSRSGKFIVGISDQGFSIWSTDAHQPMVSIEHEAPLSCASFSSDDRFIVAGTKSGKIIVWDGNQKVGEFVFIDEARWVDAVHMNGDRVIAVAKNTIKTWKLSTKEETVIEVPCKPYMWCVSSHIITDDLVALCFSHKTIKLFDLRQGCVETITLSKSEGVVYSLNNCCLSKDRKLLVLAEGDRNSLWKRSGTGDDQQEYIYDHIADFYGGSWFKYLAIRADNLAYLASEAHGGLQLYSIAATAHTIQLEKAKKALSQKDCQSPNQLLDH